MKYIHTDFTASLSMHFTDKDRKVRCLFCLSCHFHLNKFQRLNFVQHLPDSTIIKMEE